MASDARVRYTQMIIKQQLVELLKVKPLNKITVKEICDLAEINRSTFYKHYEDVYDLYRNIELDMLEEFRGILDAVKKQGIKDTLIQVLEKLKKDGDMYEVLFSENSNDYFRKKMFMYCYSELAETGSKEFANVSEEKQQWTFYFLVWGSSGILDCWFKNGKKNSSEEVASFIEALIDSTVKTLIQD